MINEADALGILGLYQEKLSELRTTEKVPIGFETYADSVKKTLEFLPKDDKQIARTVVIAGLLQVEYMRAKEITDQLKDGEEDRLKTIDDFLE